MSASRLDCPGPARRAARAGGSLFARGKRPARLRRLGSAWLCALALSACAPGPRHEAVDGAASAPMLDGLDASLALPGARFDAGQSEASPAPLADPSAATGGPARPDFCARPGADAVRDLFCDAGVPAVGSLYELQRLLRLDPLHASGSAYYGSEDGGAPTQFAQSSDASVLLNLNLVLLGHSTALSGSLVSPINPRAILMGETTFMAFHRGVQRVELIAQARDQDRLNFYLVSFGQACNAASGGCTPGDLYTARIESDWQRISVRDDEELKNTSADCRQCHQRGVDKPILLMRERTGPWTHFFAHDRDDVPTLPYPEPLGRELVLDYRRAKGDEAYAGMPIAVLRGTIGLALESRVSLEQPLLFDGTTILNERWPQLPDGTYTGPNRSPTWDHAYQAFKRGEQLALPYYLSRATDPDKQAALSDAYQRYRAGQLRADELPNLADIYPDDAQTRAEMGVQTEPYATAAEALIQSCGSCHNDVLDQTISRARFSIDLARMGHAERAQAIARIQLPSDGEGAMPPPETRQLDAAARAKLIAYLQSETRSAEDDALLTRAAKLGMAVIAPRPQLIPLSY